jgi:ABC-type branched-subunit amino acid transport system substrate-binding protein
MSYENKVEPIKFGYLFDLTLPPGAPGRKDLPRAFELIFNEGYKKGAIDRPVEVIFKEVEGLPKGSVKAVIDTYAELVDEGCIAIFGPSTSDNAVPMREEIERRFRIPTLSVAGSEDWLGEWTFSLPQGSLTEEPIFWARMLAKRGCMEVGALVEQSLIGETYITNFRRACRKLGIRIVAEEPIAQIGLDVDNAVRRLYEANAPAFVHCGFGFGLAHVNTALKKLQWDPPRYMGTAYQTASLNPAMYEAIKGWTGICQYDEENLIGQKFLDQFKEVYGYRPDRPTILCNRDLAMILLEAFSNAQPLSPRGVKEALERVKMIPAASGAPGTQLSFGKWLRRGWMGSGYLVARELEAENNSPELLRSRLVDRFGQDWSEISRVS